MANTLVILKRLIDIFEKNKIKYIIGGNTGLILQNVKVKDDKEIDICTNKRGAYKIQELLKKYVVKEVKYQKLMWFKAHWGIFKMRGITIEVMGNPKRKFKNGIWRGLLKENIKTIIFEDKAVNIFTLKSEYEYYKKISKRGDKKEKIANAIKKVLQNQKP